MSEKLRCEIVKDLLPTYRERLTSEVTNKAIESHLEDCGVCRQYWQQIDSKLEEEKAEIRELKHAWRKTKWMYLMKVLAYILCASPILVCFIVDLAVNRQFTWFYLVAGGCALLYTVAGLLIFRKKNKLVSAMAGFSILVLPYLFLIQEVVNRCFLESPINWMANLAIPVTLLWLGIAWLTVAARKALKWNLYFCLAFFMTLGTPGSLVTNFLSNASSGWSGALADGWTGVLSTGVFAVVFWVLGFAARKKEKAHANH